MSNELLDIGMDLDDVVDLYAVEDGEYELMIQGVRVDQEKHYVMLNLEIQGDDYEFAKQVTEFIHLPTKPGLTSKQVNGRKRRMRDFCEAFGIDTKPPWDIEGWVGLTGWGYLGTQESDQYGEQNTVRKWGAAR